MLPMHNNNYSAMINWRDSQGSSLLHVHACVGDVALTKTLLELGCDVRVKNDRDETPLTCADFDKPRLIGHLLKAGADVNAINCLGQSALHLAVWARNEDSVKLLLDAGAYIDAVDRNDNTPLQLAVDAGLCHIVRILVERGAEINGSRCDHSILSLASRTRNEAIVKILLDAGADVIKENIDGTTPLHFGVWLPSSELTRVMIARGADVNKQDADGFAILHEAVYEGNINQVRLLLEHNANVSIRTLEGDTPLHWAAFGNTADSYEIVEYLLGQGANCNEGNVDNTTPFHFALKKSDRRLMELLLEHGADLGAVNFKGETALHFVAENHDLAVMERVLEFGFDLDDRNISGFGALHYAAESGNAEGCRLLLKRGADIGAKCHMGRSPLYLAVRMQQQESIELLLERGANVFDRTSSGESVLEASIENGNEILSNILVRHMAMIQSAGAVIGDADRRTIEFNEDLVGYFRVCRIELEKLRARLFYNSVSLLDLLVANAGVLSGYARNDELLIAFTRLEYGKIEFPIYFDSVAKRFYKEARKQHLLSIAASILSDIFNFNDPLHIANQKILSYLTDDDLEYFIQ